MFFYTHQLNNGNDTISDFNSSEGDKIVLGDLINLSGLNATGENPATGTSNQYITTADLFNNGSINQLATWSLATKTLSFDWGGSVVLNGYSGSAANIAALITDNTLLLTSDGFNVLI